MTVIQRTPLRRDPYFSKVVLLVGFDDQEDGDTAATDESPLANTLTFTGAGAAIDTAQAAFGRSSVNFASNSYVSVPDQIGVSFDNAFDKTYECRFRTTDNTQQQGLFNKRDGSSAEEGYLAINGASGFLSMATFISGTIDVNIIGTTTVTNNAWHHGAMCRASGVWYLFLDGNLEGSAAEGGTPTGNSEPLHIGNSQFNTGRWMRGWIDEARVTHGVARYISNFKVPAHRFPRR